MPADAASVLLRVPISPATSNLIVRRTMPDGTVVSERRDAVQFCPLQAFLAAVKDGKVTTQSQAGACGR